MSHMRILKANNTIFYLFFAIGGRAYVSSGRLLGVFKRKWCSRVCNN